MCAEYRAGIAGWEGDSKADAAEAEGVEVRLLMEVLCSSGSDRSQEVMRACRTSDAVGGCCCCCPAGCFGAGLRLMLQRPGSRCIELEACRLGPASCCCLWEGHRCLEPNAATMLASVRGLFASSAAAGRGCCTGVFLVLHCKVVRPSCSVPSSSMNGLNATTLQGAGPLWHA